MTSQMHPQQSGSISECRTRGRGIKPRNANEADDLVSQVEMRPAHGGSRASNRVTIGVESLPNVVSDAWVGL